MNLFCKSLKLFCVFYTIYFRILLVFLIISINLYVSAFMYVWSENVASRGGQEIGSCLLRHFREHLAPSVKRIILYSDSCGGQNRNIKMSMLLSNYLCTSSVDFIEQRFFVSGHSYNSCDRMFGIIEQQSKLHERIETPDRWIDIIKNAKQSRPKFCVSRMDIEDFKSVEQIDQVVTNRKVVTEKQKVNWLKARRIIYDREQPWDLFL